MTGKVKEYLLFLYYFFEESFERLVICLTKTSFTEKESVDARYNGRTTRN